MRERWVAWCAAAGVVLGAVFLEGGARAEEGQSCSPWRAAPAPHERLALRACQAKGASKAVAGGARAGVSPGAEGAGAGAVPAEAVPAEAGDERAGGSEGEAEEGDVAEDEAGGAKEERDDRSGVQLELRSGYEDGRTVRVELTLAGGGTDALEVTLAKGVTRAGGCGKCRAVGDVTGWRVLEGTGAEGVDEPLSPVAATTHMQVLARDLRLTPTNAERLKRLAASYYKATRKRLVVTGGTRPPLRQAQLMYDKLKRGEDLLALYENKAAAVEIRNAYRAGVGRSLSRKRVVLMLKEVIEAQMGRGVYVSKHLGSGAVDVRSWDMSAAMEQALREAVKREPGVSLMDERKSAEPHFHLTLR